MSPVFSSSSEMSRELIRKKSAKKKGKKSAADDDSEDEMELSDEEVQHPQLLPPVCEGYAFTGVCLSSTGGRCLPHCMLGYPPRPEADPPPPARPP